MRDLKEGFVILFLIAITAVGVFTTAFSLHTDNAPLTLLGVVDVMSGILTVIIVGESFRKSPRD